MNPTVKPHVLALGVLPSAVFEASEPRPLEPRVEAASIADTIAALAILPMQFRMVFGERLRATPPPGFQPMTPRGHSRGELVSAAFEELLALGAEAALLVRDDVPLLPTGELFDAMLALPQAHGLILGALEDGSIYALGLTRLDPRLFASMNESASELAARAAALGIEVRWLPQSYAVRQLDDLRRLSNAVNAGAARACAGLLASGL